MYSNPGQIQIWLCDSLCRTVGLTKNTLTQWADHKFDCKRGQCAHRNESLAFVSRSRVVMGTGSLGFLTLKK